MKGLIDKKFNILGHCPDTPEVRGSSPLAPTT